jgi:hypothetical protein
LVLNNYRLAFVSYGNGVDETLVGQWDGCVALERSPSVLAENSRHTTDMHGLTWTCFRSDGELPINYADVNDRDTVPTDNQSALVLRSRTLMSGPLEELLVKQRPSSIPIRS